METHAESFQFKQCETLKSHLELLGLGDYIAVFNAARIDMVLFKGMTEEDLLEAGIKDGPIRIIMNERNQVVTCLISSRSTPQLCIFIHCGRFHFTNRSSATTN